MKEREARALQRALEELLDGDEVGYLKAEESEYVEGHWGVTIRLTSPIDRWTLREALLRSEEEPHAVRRG